MRLQWPLTGRAEEMRIIAAAISAADIAGIVVWGAAGVGKSRIVREALSAAAAGGAETRWAVATTAARALPLGAFASFASSARPDTLQLVRSVISALTAASPGTPVVVAVDDVHLLDELSTFVLQQIVQRRAAKVVLTVRTDEPVRVGIREIWTAGEFDRIDLQPLSRNETTTLLSATLGGPVDPDAARRLWNLTRGNVLYLRNFVEQGAADGRLTQHHGYWTWKGEPVVPSSLVEMIEVRTEALPRAVGYVIDALAVGEPIELAALCRITDPAAVEEADVSGLIKIDRVDGRIEVRVAHPLYAEVRRDRTPATRRRRLCGRVAAELAVCDDRDDIRTVVRRATLSLESDLTPDADLLVRAAHGAVWLADLPLADRLADAAARAGAGAEASFIRGCILSGLSRGTEADAVLANASTISLTDADHSRLVFIRAMNMLFTLADPIAAKELIDAASVVTPQEARSCIDASFAVYWATMGKPEAARIASHGLSLDELPAVVGAMTARAIAVASGDAGHTSEAVAAADAGSAIVEGSFDAASLRFVVADGHVGALLESGRIPEALLATERLRRQSADLPGAAQLFGAAVAGRASLGAGHLDSACSLLEPVELILASGDTNGWGYRYLLPRTICAAMRGAVAEAAAALATLEKQRHPSMRYLDYEYALAQGWVAAVQGAVSQSIRIVLAAAEIARANGQFGPEVLCLQTVTQFGDGSSVRRLHELAEIVDGPRAGLAACFANALHAGHGDQLAKVSEEFEEMGDLIAAIDAAALAALAYRRKDLRGSAFGCSTRADALAEQCGGANTPALRWASERLPLTSREREIVMLLAEGLTSPAIAERLTLSTRTVEGHIYRAMAKTGTASRDKLASLLPRRR